MLRAYCDASAKGGIHAVAGVGFGEDRAKKATHAFAKLFGMDRQCHMTDLHNQKKQFKDIGCPEAARLCTSAVEIINRYATVIVVASCDEADVERLAPRDATPDSLELLDPWASPYNVCNHWIMHVLGRKVGEYPKQQVAYWFEKGDKFQMNTNRFLSKIKETDRAPVRRSYAYGSHQFVAAKDARLFEAPDIVAWEWVRHVERFRKGHGTSEGVGVRKSLSALMDGDQTCVFNGFPAHSTPNRHARHFTGPTLERFFGKLSRVMKATTKEEVTAAATSREWDEFIKRTEGS